MRFACLVFLGISALASTASALDWPDTKVRVDARLGSPDVNERRLAAREISGLGKNAAQPLVLRAIADKDAEVRLAVVGVAQSLRDPQITDAVASWFGDPDARIRAAACQLARQAPSAQTLPLLARTLSDSDAAVRTNAAAALGSSRTPEALTALLGKLDDSAPNVRTEVVRSLARTGDPRSTIPLLGKTQDSNSEVRREVARALGILADARSLSALAVMLRDNVAEVRVAAVTALGRFKSDDAALALEPLVAERTGPLRMATLEALGRIATPEAQRILLLLLGSNDDQTSGLDSNAVREALLTTDRATLTPKLVAIVSAGEAPPRSASAAWILGQLGGKSAPAGALNAIVNGMRRGTLPAAFALRAMQGLRADSTLSIALEQLTAVAPVTRGEARLLARVLLHPETPDGRAIDPIVHALADERASDAEKGELLDLLGRTGEPRCVPALTAYLKNPSIALRIEAVNALSHIVSSATEDALLEAIAGDDARLRLAAAEALGQVGGTRARRAIVAALNDDKPSDRLALLHALAGLNATSQDRAEANQAVNSLLAFASSEERDLLFQAKGRGGFALDLAHTEPRDIAAYVRGGSKTRETHTVVLAALANRDANVRAEAAYALARIGDAGDLDALSHLVHAEDDPTAANAVLALAHIGARAPGSNVTTLLCEHARDPRPWVRGNVLRGLALLNACCGNGEAEREALTHPEEHVRAAAAELLGRNGATAEDAFAREVCVATDPSRAVAGLCAQNRFVAHENTASDPRPRPLTLYLASQSGAISPDESFALQLGDGFVRRGRTDRRGVVYDPAPPAGSIRRIRLQFAQ